jgi:hypothetical protein
MCEPAMMSKGKNRPPNATEHIEVGRFSGQRQRERGERGFAVQSRATEARSGQKMGDGFHVVERSILAGLE